MGFIYGNDLSILLTKYLNAPRKSQHINPQTMVILPSRFADQDGEKESTKSAQSTNTATDPTENFYLLRKQAYFIRRPSE